MVVLINPYNESLWFREVKNLQKINIPQEKVLERNSFYKRIKGLKKTGWKKQRLSGQAKGRKNIVKVWRNAGRTKRREKKEEIKRLRGSSYYGVYIIGVKLIILIKPH